MTKNPYEKPRCAYCGRVIQTGRAMRVSPHEIESYVVCSLQCAVDSRAPDDEDDAAAPSSATPATTSAPRALVVASDELTRLRAENERLRAEVRDLYARLTEVRDVQRSLETLIVAGVAALEAVDRLGLQAPTSATQPTAQSPSLLAWLRGVLAKRPDARPDPRPDAPPPRH